MDTSFAEIKRAARHAGLLYFVASIIGVIGLAYVPGKLFVPGNAAETVARITAHPSLLRIGIASDLVSQTIWVFMVLALYRLFRGVDEGLARQMLVLGALIEVPIMFLTTLHEIAALILISGADFLSAFAKPQLDALAYLFVRLHSQGINLAAIFWGLWLFPFGMLVRRCEFIPRFLGTLLFITGASYLVDSFTTIVAPQYSDAIGSVARIGGAFELPIIFWLLIWGAREAKG
jgi:hypothetical protein